jgi:thiosulfate/3-mercaptopyruvate sulfurtransferase
MKNLIQKYTKLSAMLMCILTIGIISLTGCTSTKEEVKESEFKTISTDELKTNIEKKDWIVVDTRSNDAYNGWKEDDVKRGGHIKGATDFSANWIKVDVENKDKKIEKSLKDKDMTTDKNIALYDTNGKDAQEVAKFLKEKGYENIYIYDAKQWIEDESLPMESYENYEMFVPAWWVNDVINGKKPETYENNNFKVFEVSWGDLEAAKDYKNGHIPGAVHINTDEMEEPPVWNRKVDSELEKFALNNGITIDTTTILYGEDPLASQRIAAILNYMGVKDVRVINGGTLSWKTAGYEMEKDINEKQPVDAFGTKVPANKQLIVNLPEAKEMFKDESSRMADVRTWDEFIGKTPGYSDITIKGRPQGALWAHAGIEGLSDMAEYRNPDNTMRNGYEVEKMWANENITRDQKIAFYCGTGWRAAETLNIALVMGFENAHLWDGGWYEWITEPANPIELGEPKDAKLEKVGDQMK